MQCSAVECNLTSNPRHLIREDLVLLREHAALHLEQLRKNRAVAPAAAAAAAVTAAAASATGVVRCGSARAATAEPPRGRGRRAGRRVRRRAGERRAAAGGGGGRVRRLGEELAREAEHATVSYAREVQRGGGGVCVVTSAAAGTGVTTPSRRDARDATTPQPILYATPSASTGVCENHSELARRARCGHSAHPIIDATRQDCSTPLVIRPSATRQDTGTYVT